MSQLRRLIYRSLPNIHTKYKVSDKMSNYPTPDTPIKTIGLGREICTVNGRTFTRKEAHNHGQSIPQKTSPIHHAQGPGEPFHWSLFVAHENQPGSVYQVKGDAESMAYDPENLVNETQAESFSTLYKLAVVSEEQARVFVIENCQGWSVRVFRVIAKLAERGIVPHLR
ncbi:hypothetical protein N7467_008876 [Penicillium canescens]|nr:hypothetical protein N7467_008876 [Penicillium canescens]